MTKERKAAALLAALLLLCTACGARQKTPPEEPSPAPTVQAELPCEVCVPEMPPDDLPEKTPDAVCADDAPAAPQSPASQDSAPPTCTLSVSCAVLLDHLDELGAGKASLVPPDGILLPERTVVLCENDSVFDVLLREMRAEGIHLEYTDTPVYGSAYIEGIGNLYEFDCGDLSGWMYCVNGVFVNYGCSQYALSCGDTVEWLYTCDLGADIGGASSAGS